MNNAEVPGTVGRGGLFSVGCIRYDGDGCAADDGTRSIDDRASDGSIHGSLRMRDRGNQSADRVSRAKRRNRAVCCIWALLKIWVFVLLDLDL